jgi:hypothetical protein
MSAIIREEAMEFTHFDQAGNALMVDVGGKKKTLREAAAEGFIYMSPDCFEKIRDGATFAEPVLPPEGIDYVLIGGEIAAKDCQIVNGNLGKAIRG